MFGKRNSEHPEENVETTVDTMPRPEPAPTKAGEEPVTMSTPPPSLKPEPEPGAMPPASDGFSMDMTTDTELARLRDILFGGQARSTEKRMSDLELRVEAVRQELAAQIDKKVSDLDTSSGNQLAATRTDFVERLNLKTDAQSQNLRTAQQELNDKIDQQNTDLNTQIRSTQRDLSERLDAQQTEQATQLREVQKDLSQRLDTLTTDFMSQLRQIQKDLSDRLDKLNETQIEQSRSLQAESKQRDDELRQELMSFASLLESKKVSRADLGQMLAELGQRMRSDTD